MNSSPSPVEQTGGGDFFGSVESLLASARRQQGPIHPTEWLKDARALGLSLTSEGMLESSDRLLGELSRDELKGLLYAAQQEPQEHLTKIRRHRRVLLIARDAIILSTAKHDTPGYTQLRELCQSLGRFADSLGTNKNYLYVASNSLESAFDAPQEAVPFLQKDASFRQKYELSLGALGLMRLFKTADDSSGHSFHDRRKSFRRAANVMTIHAAETAIPNDISIAVQGIRINTALGQISDQLDTANDRV